MGCAFLPTPSPAPSIWVRNEPVKQFKPTTKGEVYCGIISEQPFLVSSATTVHRAEAPTTTTTTRMRSMEPQDKGWSYQMVQAFKPATSDLVFMSVF